MLCRRQSVDLGRRCSASVERKTAVKPEPPMSTRSSPGSFPRRTPPWVTAPRHWRSVSAPRCGQSSDRSPVRGRAWVAAGSVLCDGPVSHSRASWHCCRLPGGLAGMCVRKWEDRLSAELSGPQWGMTRLCHQQRIRSPCVRSATARTLSFPAVAPPRAGTGGYGLTRDGRYHRSTISADVYIYHWYRKYPAWLASAPSAMIPAPSW